MPAISILKGLRRPLVAALLLGASVLPAAAETLADAMVMAYRNSALLEQQRAVLRAADEDVASAVSALRPVVQWIVQHQYNQVEGRDTTQISAQLLASMTLFDWGRSRLAIDAAKETVMATREALEGVEQQVILTAVQAYLDVRSAIQQVSLQENSVNLLTQELRAAEDRFEVGEITTTDVSLARAQLAATQASLSAARGQLEVARESYRAATGKLPGNLSSPPPLPTLPANLRAAEGIAVRTHPSILQAERSVAASEIGVAAAAAERNPTLEAQASIARQRGRSANSTSNAIQDIDSKNLAIQMSQTLYSGGALSASHRQAMAQRDQARASLLNTSRTVVQAVATYWANIDVARAQIASIDQQISAAQQAYNGVREEALLGARTTLDVLDAEQNLLEARSNRVTAEANLQLAHYQLLSAMGLLTVENLKLGIPTYDPSAYYNAVRTAPTTTKRGERLDRVLDRFDR